MSARLPSRSSSHTNLGAGPARRALGLSTRLDQGVRYLWLNVLWSAAAATVVGAPAATVALHQVLREWSTGDDQPVAARFVHALRTRGVRATQVAALALPFWVLLVVDLLLVGSMGTQGLILTTALLSVALPVLLACVVATRVVGEGQPTLRLTVSAVLLRLVSAPASAVSGTALAAVSVMVVLAFPPLLLVVPSVSARLWMVTDRLWPAPRRAATRPSRRLARTA